MKLDVKTFVLKGDVILFARSFKVLLFFFFNSVGKVLVITRGKEVLTFLLVHSPTKNYMAVDGFTYLNSRNSAQLTYKLETR
jgi:hypothetical protein